MNQSQPLVSVVVPVFNGERYLCDALDSVRRQNYPKTEVIVVDDGSTDGTPALMHELSSAANAPIAIRQDNQGPSAARNRAIEAASGELIAFLDADDVWPDDKLHRQVECLTADPELDVVLGRIKYVTLEGAVMPAMVFEDQDEKTVSNVHLGSGVFRRSAFDRVGLFDEELRFGEDQDWFLRARELGATIRILPDVTLVYRLHTENTTLKRTRQEVALTRVLKKSLDRRRATGRSELTGKWLDYDDSARE